MHGQRQGAICAGYSPGGGGTLECLYTGRCVDVLKKKVYFFLQYARDEGLIFIMHTNMHLLFSLNTAKTWTRTSHCIPMIYYSCGNFSQMLSEITKCIPYIE